MSRPQILYDFSPKRYSDAELKMKAWSIIEKMTANPHFPHPDPSLMQVKQAAVQYDESLVKSKEGNKAETLVKKRHRVQLQQLLRELAWYVQSVSNDNASVILSSGFGIQKIPAKIGPLPQPTGFSVKHGIQSGSVMLRCDVIKDAKFYAFQYALEPVCKDTIWNLIGSSKHKVTIEGLTIEKYYAFRVAGIGADSSRSYSEPIIKLMI